MESSLESQCIQSSVLIINEMFHAFICSLLFGWNVFTESLFKIMLIDLRVIPNKVPAHHNTELDIIFLEFHTSFCHLLYPFFYLSGYLFLVFFTSIFPLFLKYWGSSDSSVVPVLSSLYTHI